MNNLCVALVLGTIGSEIVILQIDYFHMIMSEQDVSDRKTYEDSIHCHKSVYGKEIVRLELPSLKRETSFPVHEYDVEYAETTRFDRDYKVFVKKITDTAKDTCDRGQPSAEDILSKGNELIDTEQFLLHSLVQNHVCSSSITNTKFVIVGSAGAYASFRSFQSIMDWFDDNDVINKYKEKVEEDRVAAEELRTLSNQDSNKESDLDSITPPDERNVRYVRQEQFQQEGYVEDARELEERLAEERIIPDYCPTFMSRFKFDLKKYLEYLEFLPIHEVGFHLLHKKDLFEEDTGIGSCFCPLSYSFKKFQTDFGVNVSIFFWVDVVNVMVL